MCPPAVLAVGAAAVASIGTVIGGLQANAMGKYRERVAERNAALDREAIATEQENTRREAMNHWRKVAQLKGGQRLHAAAGGVSTDFGSAYDTILDTDMLAAEDARLIYMQGNERVKGLDRSVSNNIAEGRAARAEGKGKLIGSLFEAGSTMLGGVRQMKQINKGLSG